MAALPVAVLGAGGTTTADPAAAAELRAHIAAMKERGRGPFAHIRWFCADGAVLPPSPYACKDRGGGVQHGEWTDEVKRLREQGYYIANVLAGTEPETILRGPGAPERLRHILIEQFLILADDGWILRRARAYRGALQEEGERRSARRLLLAMVADDAWIGRRYVELRTAARLLPHGAETASASRVRQLSADLAERDPGFVPLRNKIHVKPGAEDSAAVRSYASRLDNAELKRELDALAAAIDTVYAPAHFSQTVARLRALAGRALAPELDMSEGRVAGAGPEDRYVLTGQLLAAARDALPRVARPADRLALLDASLAIESDHFAAATALVDRLREATRRTQVEWLQVSTEAAYGAGLLTARERSALASSYAAVAGERVSLANYKGAIGYLGLVAGWAAQRLEHHFGEAQRTLRRLEPKAARFIEDQLRGSPLFFYAQVLDGLGRDANRLAGVESTLFGRDVGTGLKALNPGLARGRLLPAPVAGDPFAEDGIYVLPETISDLPPVAGILTAGAGNPLSHVQLLARNLGIPNVAVDKVLVPSLTPHYGRPAVLAVSAGGSVQLFEDRGQGEALLGGTRPAEERTLIEPDLEKLDLADRRLRRLSDLRATDSGRVVGPKAAKLGELKHHFPEAVAEGLAIPFGVFRRLLDRRYGDGGGQGQPTAFDWMRAEYRRLAALPPGSPTRKAETERFRQALYDWILAAGPDAALREALTRALGEVFGPDGTYGVFVRSDTNVEDLPGFTGAGLNLTVPNVVGVDAILAAVPRVWASPFTARAFAWRQAHMSEPEHVYPAVLLMRSVPVDKSGVLVTRDIETGAEGWLSVAVNEGVGGAVDGQAAESLRINVATGEVRLLAQATATVRRRIDPRGGVEKLPVSGADMVLTPDEIRQLVALERALPQRFPAIVDASGAVAAADIEFGFLDGRLQLFQIRPFLESRRARASEYLQAMDRSVRQAAGVFVDMSEVPK